MGDAPTEAIRLSLAEWTVLGLVDEAPTHGFAVAALTAPAAELGQVWQIPRPVVYRAFTHLESLGLTRPVAVEQGRGPRRQVVAATPLGTTQVARWLGAPVEHVRDVRSQLLVKLALLERRGADPRGLLEQQRAVLARVVDGLVAQPSGAGFDATLHAWRRSAATSVLGFLDELLAPLSG